MIIEYARDKKNNPICTVVAKKIGDEVCIGWAQCNFTAGDVFSKERGRHIAEERAHKVAYLPTDNSGNWAPAWINKMLPTMNKAVTRARKYYKTDTFRIYRSDAKVAFKFTFPPSVT